MCPARILAAPLTGLVETLWFRGRNGVAWGCGCRPRSSIRWYGSMGLGCDTCPCSYRKGEPPGRYGFHFTGVTSSGVPLLELTQPDAVSLHG